MPMYLNNVPQSGQTLAATRAPINQNFQTIDAAFQVEHVGYTLANQGFHNKVTMPQQNPAPAGVAGMGLLYYFTDNEFYINKNNTTAVPFTKNVRAASGYTYLPSGIIIQWTTTGAAAGTNPGIAFPIAFPTACLSVQLTASNPTPPAQPFATLIGFTQANFSFYIASVPAGTSVNVLAIGY